MPEEFRSEFAEGISVSITGSEINDAVTNRDCSLNWTARFVLPGQSAGFLIESAHRAAIAAKVNLVSGDRRLARKFFRVFIYPEGQPGVLVESVDPAIETTRKDCVVADDQATQQWRRQCAHPQRYSC